MSLGRVRRSSRLVAVFLLIASIWQLPHRSEDDTICVPSTEAHDESKHVFTTVATADHEEHCAICHWTRWLKPDFWVRGIAAPAGDAGAELAASASLVLRDPSRDHLPARAPPDAPPSGITRLDQLS